MNRKNLGFGLMFIIIELFYYTLCFSILTIIRLILETVFSIIILSYLEIAQWSLLFIIITIYINYRNGNYLKMYNEYMKIGEKKDV